MARISPTSRTLKALRDAGVKCDVVERWIPNPKHPGGGFRRDLFNIIDIVAMDFRRDLLVGVQSTGSAFSEHWRKLTEECAEQSRDWLRIPGLALELWGWRKVKRTRGGKQMVWRPRVKRITVEDLK